MEKPHIWNPLPEAAAWLSKSLSREINYKDLINIVASAGRSGDPKPTIIKAVLPRELSFALLSMSGLRDKNEVSVDAESVNPKPLSSQCGELPVGVNYVRAAYPTVAPLVVNDLLYLLLYGEVEIAVVHNLEAGGSNELIWLMPWGNSHRATAITCGINRNDLLVLHKELTAFPIKNEDFTRVSNSPKGITKAESIIAFCALITIDLKNALEDSPNWIVDARIHRGTKGSVHKSLWDPVLLALLLNEKKVLNLQSSTKHFVLTRFCMTGLKNVVNQLREWRINTAIKYRINTGQEA